MRYFPFLKWAGGKRWLSSHADRIVPEDYGTYFEPFLGGGAMFGSVGPEKAVLSDCNAELINCYKQVAAYPDRIAIELGKLQKIHSEKLYYETRSSHPFDDFGKAIRFIYLNRTCFNGIYRVNQQGQFNVPIGTKDTVLFAHDDFLAVSKLLKKAEIRSGDFESVVDLTTSNDFLFCDPPYTVAHNNNGFVRYNEQMFSWEDQVRLCESLARAAKRGVKVLLTNAAHSSIHDLYTPLGFECRAVSRRSVIGGGNDYRGEFEEYLISNYPLPGFGAIKGSASLRSHMTGTPTPAA